MSFVKDSNVLIRQIQKKCRGHEVTTAFLAVTTVIETILEQMPNDDLRNQFLLRLIQSNLLLSAFDGIKQDTSGQDPNTLALISDNELLTVATLGKIKGLVDLCIRHW